MGSDRFSGARAMQSQCVCEPDRPETSVAHLYLRARVGFEWPLQWTQATRPRAATARWLPGSILRSLDGFSLPNPRLSRASGTQKTCPAGPSTASRDLRLRLGPPPFAAPRRRAVRFDWMDRVLRSLHAPRSTLHRYAVTGAPAKIRRSRHYAASRSSRPASTTSCCCSSGSTETI